MIRIDSKLHSKDWDIRKGYRKKVILPIGSLKTNPIQLQITLIKPGDVVNDHYHIKQTEIIYILRGKGQFSVNNNSFAVKPGDVIVIEPNEIHNAMTQDDSFLKFLTIKLNYVSANEDTIWDNEKHK